MSNVNTFFSILSKKVLTHQQCIYNSMFLNEWLCHIKWVILKRAAAKQHSYLLYYSLIMSLPKHITPHMFRPSFATMLLEEDVDIRCIQKILGHSSITTAQIYTHVAMAKQKEILSVKHPRNKIHF